LRCAINSETALDGFSGSSVAGAGAAFSAGAVTSAGVSGAGAGAAVSAFATSVVTGVSISGAMIYIPPLVFERLVWNWLTAFNEISILSFSR